MTDTERLTPETPERVTLDIGVARAAADKALSLQLGTTTRVQIESMTARLIGHIESALAELPRDAPGKPCWRRPAPVRRSSTPRITRCAISPSSCGT